MPFPYPELNRLRIQILDQNLRFEIPGVPGGLWRQLRRGRLASVNRIEQRFVALRNGGRKGLVLYIGAGDPDLNTTIALALAFDKAGVDVLELGVPFSDPLADGPVNQLAAQRGLDSGTTPERVLSAVAALRRDTQIPVVLYVYFNLLHRYGLPRFLEDAAAAGVDGLLVLDLPPEEAGDYAVLAKTAGLCAIHLIAPTTPEERIKTIVRQGSGFIYYVSREGVTGMQAHVSGSVAERVVLIRKHTALPVAVGFGVSDASQAAEVARGADAVVVGSAVVQRIADRIGCPDLVPHVVGFVGGLVAAVKGV